MVHGIIDNELSELELANIREQQVAALGGAHMGHHELAAYRGGFPPGDHCIATPAALRDHLEANPDDYIIASPMSLAHQALNDLLGPSAPLPNMKSAFGSSANAPAQEANNIAALITTSPTPGHM